MFPPGLNLSHIRFSDGWWFNPLSSAGSEEIITEYNLRLPTWRRREYLNSTLEHWKNRRQCVLAMFGVTLGFNNFLFFPSAVLGTDSYGIFVIQFIILEFLVGYPLLFLQLSIGQFTAKGPFRVCKMVPLGQGTGLALMISNIFTVMHHSVAMAWVVYYIIAAFHLSLDPEWSWETPWHNCIKNNSPSIMGAQLQECGLLGNSTAVHKSSLHCYYDYFLHTVLQTSNCNLREVNLQFVSFNWTLVGCLVFIWLVGYLFIYRGITTIGKFVVWVVPISCVLFTVFIVVGVVQSNGAVEGLKYYLTFDWHALIDIRMWYYALEYVINSMGLSNGTMIMIGAYAHFQSPAHYDAFYICVANVLFSLFTCLLLFSFIGMSATQHNVNIQDLNYKNQGTFAIFIIIPSVLENAMPFPPFWLFACFLTILLMTMTAIHTNFLVFLKPLYETFPALQSYHPACNFAIILAFFVGSAFWLALTRNGFYYVAAWNYQLETVAKWIILTSFVATFVYGYGLTRLRFDLSFMINYMPNMFFCVIWFVLPGIFLATLVYFLVVYHTDEGVHVTSGMKAVGWLAFILNVIPIPLVALVNLYQYYRRGELRKILLPVEESQDFHPQHSGIHPPSRMTEDMDLGSLPSRFSMFYRPRTFT